MKVKYFLFENVNKIKKNFGSKKHQNNKETTIIHIENFEILKEHFCTKQCKTQNV